jgi:hypothetical protein
VSALILLSGFIERILIMKTAYELYQKLIEIIADIEETLNEKSKISNTRISKALDEKIDLLEAEMRELKDKLKSIELK